MDTSAYYVPQSIAPILEAGARQQVPLASQPTGLSGQLPALNALAQGGMDASLNQQKKQSVLQAQQAYASYLAKVDDGTATQQDHAAGRMAALSLGITPPDTLGNNLKKAQTANFQSETDARNNKDAPFTIEVSNAIRRNAGMPESSAPLRPSDVPGLRLAKKPSGPDQNLTPEEMKALQGALTRSQNPLAPSMISFRGPRAKLMAQSLMQDPNWSPNAGESGLGAAKAGATAQARLNFGGDAQKSARAANTVIMLTDGLQKASNGYPRSDVRWFNTPINAINQQTGNEAMRFKQYLVDTRSKMATALQGGGVPQAEAMKVIADNFPDTMTASQVPSAIKTVKEIMRTQIGGALTAVTAADGAATDNPGGNGGGTPHPQDSAAVAWAKANPNDPRAAKILQLNAQ